MTSASTPCAAPGHAARQRLASRFQKARLAELARYTARPLANPERFLAGYRARRAAIGRKNLPIGPAVLTALARLLDGARPVAQGRIAELVGIHPRHCGAVYRATCLALGQVPCGARMPDALPPDPLVPLLSALGPLPETYVDADLGAMIPAPQPRASARVATLRCEALRLAAGLALVLAAARGVADRTQAAIVAAFAVLDERLANTEPLAPGRLGKALEAFLTDASLTPACRAYHWSQWGRAFAAIDAYCLRHASLAERYRGWHLAFPATYCARFARAVTREAKCLADVKRKARSGPVAQDRAAILACFDSRFSEIAEIRKAFDATCAGLRERKLTLRNGRHCFSLTVHSSTPDGTLIGCYTTLDFAIVTGDYLRRRVPPVGSALPLRTGASYYLAYLGTQAGNEPPLLQMYRFGCFFEDRHADSRQRAARAQLLPPMDWPTSADAYLLFRYANGVDTHMAIRCFRAGITLIPIAELHFAVAVGRAIARSVLAGARIGEAMQQRAEPDAFRAQQLSGARGFAYDAIAKGRASPEPYFLNSADFQSIVAVVKVRKANGWPIAVAPPAASLRPKCPPAKYLYQRNGRALSNAALNLAVRLPLWPRLARSHDLRHGQARYLSSQGIHERDIANFLHHVLPAPELARDELTSGHAVGVYITPTDQMLAATHARIRAILERDNEPPRVQPTPSARSLRASRPRAKATIERPSRPGYRQLARAPHQHQPVAARRGGTAA